MIGRLIGLIVGLAIAAFGYGLWKPVEFAKYVPTKYVNPATFPLGPFAEYKLIVIILTIALGIVVALASLQRQGRSKSSKPAVTLFTGSEDDHAPAHDSFAITPDAGHGHDDHGHDAHGHDDHGHDAHGHDAHGHDAHGHDDHGHDAHGHDAHGHDAHGHDAHGHDDGHGDSHGHGHDAHAPAHH